MDVYHTSFKPLEWNFNEERKDDCYCKVIVELKSGNKKVLGIHYLGPNAGEIIMGFGVAMRCGVTADVLFSTVGLHPTCAEELVLLDTTKRENANAKKTGC